MPDKKTLLTYEGLKELEQELEFLKGKKRLEIAEKIKEARSFGDLSENAEYDEAKNEQAAVEARILKIENILRNAEVIDEDEIDITEVQVGCKVRILDLEYDDEEIYHIVGSTEAEPSKCRISDESPVGSAIMHKKVGSVVQVETPSGVIKIKILDITK
ncbi:MAG: transcription elongation factor GreA [Clostridia bacterium]|nr:transcription elongation factor GreA [Clostridia bacterium]